MKLEKAWRSKFFMIWVSSVAVVTILSGCSSSAGFMSVENASASSLTGSEAPEIMSGDNSTEDLDNSFELSTEAPEIMSVDNASGLASNITEDLDRSFELTNNNAEAPAAEFVEESQEDNVVVMEFGYDDTTSDADNSTRRLRQNSRVREGMPYIIRSTWPGYWKYAELSYDASYWHPMASVEFNDPVTWQFKKQWNGNYRIINRFPDQWKDAELSWDGRHGSHPLASVEKHDPVDWGLVARGGDRYRIVNKYPGAYYNRALSWDSRHGAHPRASLHPSPVDWEIIPAFKVSIIWIPMRTLVGETVFTYSEGMVASTSWSTTRDFSIAVGATIAGEGAGLSAEARVDVTASYSHTVEETISRSSSRSETIRIPATQKGGYFWQAYVFVKSNHYNHRDSGIAAYKLKEYAITENRGQKPRCAPGYCRQETMCQSCWPGGDI